MSPWFQLVLVLLSSWAHAATLSAWIEEQGQIAALTDCKNKLSALTKDQSTSSNTLTNCQKICELVAKHYLSVGYINTVLSKRNNMMKNCAIIFFNNDTTKSFISFSGASTSKQLAKNTKAKIDLVPYVKDVTIETDLDTTYKGAITTAYKANHEQHTPSGKFWLKAYKCSEDKSLAYLISAPSGIPAIVGWKDKAITLYSGWKPCEITEQVFTLLKTKASLTDFRCGYTYDTHEEWNEAVKPKPAALAKLVPKDIDKYLGIICNKKKSFKSDYSIDDKFYSNDKDASGAPYIYKGSLTSIFKLGETGVTIPNFPKEIGNPFIKEEDDCKYFIALDNLDKIFEYTKVDHVKEDLVPSPEEDDSSALQPNKIKPWIVVKDVPDSLYTEVWKKHATIKNLIKGRDGDDIFFETENEQQIKDIFNEADLNEKLEDFQSYYKLFPAISTQAKSDYEDLLESIDIQIPVKTDGELESYLESYYSLQKTLDDAKAKMKLVNWS